MSTSMWCSRALCYWWWIDDNEDDGLPIVADTKSCWSGCHSSDYVYYLYSQIAKTGLDYNCRMWRNCRLIFQRMICWCSTHRSFNRSSPKLELFQLSNTLRFRNGSCNCVTHKHITSYVISKTQIIPRVGAPILIFFIGLLSFNCFVYI